MEALVKQLRDIDQEIIPSPTTVLRIVIVAIERISYHNICSDLYLSQGLCWIWLFRTLVELLVEWLL